MRPLCNAFLFFASFSVHGNPQGGQTPPQDAPAGQQPPQIDYAKIQQMLEGTLAAKEDTALKAYFKQQGLSQQEAEQAISAFKCGFPFPPSPPDSAKNWMFIGILHRVLET